MKSIKLMASVLAVSMILSGLAIVSGGSDSGESVGNDFGKVNVNANVEPIAEFGSIPGYEPDATVPRTALVEDYTNWGCPPCFDYNPYFITGQFLIIF